MSETAARQDRMSRSERSPDKPHGVWRRALNYVRIVASDGLASGVLVFGAAAASLLGGTSGLGPVVSGLFASGATIDAMQNVRGDILAYRRRYHPRYRDPETARRLEREGPDLSLETRGDLLAEEPRGRLEKTLVRPGLGAVLQAGGYGLAMASHLALGMASGAVNSVFLAASAPWFLGLATVAGGAALRQRRAARERQASKERMKHRVQDRMQELSRAEKIALAEKHRTDLEAQHAPGLRGFAARAKAWTRYRVGQAGVVLRDPFACAEILFGAGYGIGALATGMTPWNIAAGLTIAAGGVVQAIQNKWSELRGYRARHRPAFMVARARRRRARQAARSFVSMSGPFKKLRRGIAHWAKTGLGYAMQAAGIGAYAFANPVGSLIWLEAGFGLSTGLQSVGKAVKAVKFAKHQQAAEDYVVSRRAELKAQRLQKTAKSGENAASLEPAPDPGSKCQARPPSVPDAGRRREKAGNARTLRDRGKRRVRRGRKVDLTLLKGRSR